jgi:hypothetical protein
MTYMPPPHPKAVMAAMERLRESMALREEVRTTEAKFMPASFLEDDSSVTISYIALEDLREMLRVIEAEEAARAAAKEAFRPRMGVAKGRFEVPESIDAENASIAKAFEGEEPAFLELPDGEFVDVPPIICVWTR